MGRDRASRTQRAQIARFNPRAPCGARLRLGTNDQTIIPFQSTRPMRGATAVDTFGGGDAMFQSTRPMRGATRNTRHEVRRPSFNPRAPCGARLPGPPLLRRVQSFNPRAPCGARRFQGFIPVGDCSFNPRAPCGARHDLRLLAAKGFVFQSTRPVWGATNHAIDAVRYGTVSIHAPRVGRDTEKQRSWSRRQSFNPRAPCGARLLYHVHGDQAGSFNPRAHGAD